MEKTFDIKTKKQIGTRIVTVFLSLLFVALIIYFWSTPKFYLSGNTNKGILRSSFFILTSEILICVIGLFLIVLRGRLTKLFQKYSRILLVIITFCTPFITLLFTDVIVRGIPRNFKSANYNLHFSIEAILYNILIIAMLLILLLVLKNNLKASCILCLFTGIFFCIANYYVF